MECAKALGHLGRDITTKRKKEHEIKNAWPTFISEIKSAFILNTYLNMNEKYLYLSRIEFPQIWL